jgi:hypothetical protein
MRMSPLVLTAMAGTACASPPITFTDVTDAVGLGGLAAARVALVDVNGDGRPDAVVDRRRIFLNTPGASDAHGFRFVEVSRTGLPSLAPGDSVVFADLDGDGIPDAIVARSIDTSRQSDDAAAEEPARTAWHKGVGDGTFGPGRPIEAARPATTSAIAVGDVNLDGKLDLYLGNWYSRYGQSVEAFTNDLLIQSSADAGAESEDQPRASFTRWPLAEDAHAFDDDTDAAGRPTYGVMIASVLRWPPSARDGNAEPGASEPDAEETSSAAAAVVRGPQLLELNYGRRANRLWSGFTAGEQPEGSGAPAGTDVGALVGFDGDEVRDGVYPDWLKALAERDARFRRADEKPFRSHGNTFDVAVGDINNDGQFDLFFAEITHGWAGDSSDRSRLLLASRVESSPLTTFVPSPHSFDRIPPIPPRDQWSEGWFPRWNQGDLFCEFADLDNDGLLDVIISSGDYPDAPPFEQRLRIFRQQQDGSFADVTTPSGLQHVGSQQISLGDVDGDGQIDILVGQTFNRFTPAMIEKAGGEPKLRLFLNRTHTPAAAPEQSAPAAGEEGEALEPEPRRVANAITLTLVGDPALGVNRDALGAIVRLHSSAGGRAAYQSRQLIGIGGHAGKQHQFLVHFGLAEAQRADRIEIHWPAAGEISTTLLNVMPGHHTVRLAPDVP